MTAIIVIVVAVILVIWGVSMYNGLVKLRNNRENAFANIDVQLKQRYDLVPQLIDGQGIRHSRKGCARKGDGRTCRCDECFDY